MTQLKIGDKYRYYLAGDGYSDAEIVGLGPDCVAYKYIRRSRGAQNILELSALPKDKFKMYYPTLIKEKIKLTRWIGVYDPPFTSGSYWETKQEANVRSYKTISEHKLVAIAPITIEIEEGEGLD